MWEKNLVIPPGSVEGWLVKVVVPMVSFGLGSSCYFDVECKTFMSHHSKPDNGDCLSSVVVVVVGVVLVISIGLGILLLLLPYPFGRPFHFAFCLHVCLWELPLTSVIDNAKTYAGLL